MTISERSSSHAMQTAGATQHTMYCHLNHLVQVQINRCRDVLGCRAVHQFNAPAAINGPNHLQGQGNMQGQDISIVPTLHMTKCGWCSEWSLFNDETQWVVWSAVQTGECVAMSPLQIARCIQSCASDIQGRISAAAALKPWRGRKL